MAKNKTVKKKVGRPELPFDWQLFDKLCARNLSKADCCDLLNVDEKVIDRRLEKLGTNFRVYRNKKMSVTRLKLVDKALDHALKKDNITMLIFSLKNLCGWKDRYDDDDKDDGDKTKVIKLKYSIEKEKSNGETEGPKKRGRKSTK